jgi:putative transposase
LLLSRYIALNPVSANMVEHPVKYPRSSYHNNALNKQIMLLTPHPCYLALGNTLSKRKQVYQSLFQKRISELPLTEMCDVTNKYWVLGDNRFKQRIENKHEVELHCSQEEVTKDQSSVKVLLMLNDSVPLLFITTLQ